MAKVPTDPSGVLELRIHGVNNTAPPDMLDLPDDAVERVLGDELAGFWRQKPDAQDRLRPGDRGWCDKRLTREAYSWGGLARTTVEGTGKLAAIGRGISRAGWALVLPFGVANLAYWSRRVDPVGAASPKPRTPLPPQASAEAPVGAGGVRLFGLGLTALAVVTVSEVSMDLIATQCYAGGENSCDRLPSQFDFLADRQPALRLVLAAIVPIALLGLVYFLSAVTRARYERTTAEGLATAGMSGAALAPMTTDRRGDRFLLASPGFWTGDRMVTRLARAHLALGVSVIAILLAWPGTFGGNSSCRTPAGFLPDGDDFFVERDGSSCWTSLDDSDLRAHVWLLVCLAIAGLLCLAACAAVTFRATDAADLRVHRERQAAAKGSTAKQPQGGLRDWRTWVLVLAVGNLAQTALVLAIDDPKIDVGEERQALVGVSAAPTIVLAFLIALTVTGLFSRRLGTPFGTWLIALPVLGLLLAPAVVDDVGLLIVAIVLVGVPLVLVMVVPCWRGEGESRDVAWRGTAPGVFLGLALIMAVTMSSLLTLAFGNWLNGGRGAADLLGADRDPDATGTHLKIAAPYVWFGLAVLIAVGLLALIVIVMVVLTAFGSPPAATPRPGAPAWPSSSPAMAEKLVSARRFAGRAHRAEPALAIFVGLGVLSVLGATLVSVTTWPGDLDTSGEDSFVRKAISSGAVVLAALGVVLFGALIGGGVKGKARPFGLLWDLVAVLPRAAHPFGPPCYAERAVPELVDRCQWWLKDDGADAARSTPEKKGWERRRGDRVVLSAHSLGSVLAVATIFALPDRGMGTGPQPIRLLTYGTQLRAYFGRLFPELIGPRVLGVPPVGAARCWAADPWRKEVTVATSAILVTDSVIDRLGGKHRWRSLWRRTDYLGFPVESYGPTIDGIDWPADEVDQTGYLVEVLSHSNYFRTPEYQNAFDELLVEPAGWP